MKFLNRREKILPVLFLAALFLSFTATSAVLAQSGDAEPPGETASMESNGPETWLRDLMPEDLKNSLLLLEHWQWLTLLGIILLGAVIDRVVVFLVRSFINRILQQRKGEESEGDAFSPEIWKNSERPFGIMSWSGFVLLVMPWLLLPEGINRILVLATSVVLAGAGVWASYRVVDVLSVFLAKLAATTRTKLDDMLIPFVRRTAKVFVLAIGVVFVAQNMGIEVGSLLAGLGIGGLAFALAAKDMVANFFGSITVLFDQPFQIGDWVVVGTTEGTVEKVGFRSTRIRTFYNSLITMPNSKLIDTSVDNFGMREFRRYKSTFSIAYDTPPLKIEAFCEALRELVRIHPYTRKEYFHVYFNDMAESSLSIMIYIFHKCPDWATELRERHRFLVDSMKIAAALGVEYAFPTRTVHIPGFQGLPEPTKGKAAGRAKKDEFKAKTQDEALEAGRVIARNVVAETLEPGQVPGPVKIP